MIIDEALALATRRLAEAGVDSARLDARLLLASVEGLSASAVLLDPGGRSRPMPRPLSQHWSTGAAGASR